MKGVNLRLNVPVPNHHEFATLVHGVSDQEYEDPPLPETLLADALYASDSAEHPDLRMATLFAAMACEVKMIETMRNLASQEQVELLEMVFDRRVVQGVALFKKGISAICGRSLARDDPSLYQALAKLFKDRNTIAHLGGAGLMEGDLKGHAQTARKVLDWIDGVIADASQQQSFLASSTASGSSTP
jgi:hypothetical protein